MTAETSPYARVIADSIYEGGCRLTTMEVRFNRFVLAEANTHRVFSRNSASSRAIPLWKQIEKVTKTPAHPLVYPLEQKGMQGGDELSPEALAQAQDIWEDAAEAMGRFAESLGEIKVHKSVANRLLEPFLMQTVIITSTAWNNFLGLRDNPLAQPEIAVPARLVKEAMEASEPTVLREGEWHLPFIQEAERDAFDVGHLVKMSASRVARVSYLTHDREIPDPATDVDLYEKLTAAWPMHASPLEHVATPAPWNVHEVEVAAVGLRKIVQQPGGVGVEIPTMTLTLPMYGNFLGWHQNRFDVEIAKGYQAFA